MTLAQLLFEQGFGTRREVDGRILAGTVRLGADIVDDPDAPVVPRRGLPYEVDGQAWEYHASALVLLHKPAGYECSMKPRHHPGVLSLLPPPLRTRGLQPVGRLDVETTGALLLTDDGALLHRLTSPRHHVEKLYRMRTARPVDDAQLRRLLDGVMLDGEPRPARALRCERTQPCSLDLVIDEGRYHQVRRMLAAVGNHVEQLHRVAVGPWTLPDALAPGQWCWVDPDAAAAPHAAPPPSAATVAAPSTPAP